MAEGLGSPPDLVDRLRARCCFPPGDGPLTCAVSGGADSLTLLVLACSTGREVTAIHVDHGLRVGSESESEVVERAASRFGARFESRTVEVGPGPNLEARARAARYDVLPTGVLTGHTADDQAETVLLQLLRGGALDALAAMRPDRRPLLSLRRRETEELCSELGLEPVRDPSNRDPRFRRNRVRMEVLPLLREVFERDPVPLLARSAALARDEVDLLETLAAGLDPTDVASMASCHPALARRALRRWLRRRGHPPDAATIQRVMDVIGGRARATEVGAGRRVRRSQGRLHLEDPNLGVAPGVEEGNGRGECPPPVSG